jgi:hypothetical protein
MASMPFAPKISLFCAESLNAGKVVAEPPKIGLVKVIEHFYYYGCIVICLFYNLSQFHIQPVLLIILVVM